MNKTPRQRIETLLKIHGGHCFIVATCADFHLLHLAAIGMQIEGLLTFTKDTGPTAGLDVKRKGYSAKRFRPLAPEAPTR